MTFWDKHIHWNAEMCLQACLSDIIPPQCRHVVTNRRASPLLLYVARQRCRHARQAAVWSRFSGAVQVLFVSRLRIILTEHWKCTEV